MACIAAVVAVLVALVITAVVYGVVAGIVKMDDVGLRLIQRSSAFAKKVGRGLVAGRVPVRLQFESIAHEMEVRPVQ